jgi:serine/threonine protein kinase
MIERQYIGRYRVIGRLGTGGMGTVLRAMDEVRGREVALKLPNDVDPQTINFLQQECAVLSQLEHHNIVQVFGSGSDPDPDLPFYIVMEYVDGVTVENLLHQEQGRLEPRRALKIALGVADALAYAHKPPLRIIHRDIKPGNIMIRRSDEMVKVTDFGIAAVLSSQRSGRTAVGTLAYMSPEQATGQGVDERSDLYSLGAMLYEMLTGQRSPQLASVPPRPPGAWIAGNLPLELRTRVDRLVMGLLQADRDQRRPQRAAEVAEELRAMLEGRPSRPAASAQVGNGSVLQTPTQRAARVAAPVGYPPPPPAPRPTVPVQSYTNYPPNGVPYRPPAPPVYPPPVRPPPRQPAYPPPATALPPGRVHTATFSLLLGLVAAVTVLIILNITHSAEAIRGLHWPPHPILALSGSFPQGTLNHISFVLLLVCVGAAVLAIILGRRARRTVLESGKRLRGGGLAFLGRTLGILSLVGLALILLVAR